MTRLTRRGYFSQRKGLAFALQLGVQCGDNNAICFRFRPSGFFLQAECELPSTWRKDENGHFYVWTRNTEIPNGPTETDQNGIRYSTDGYTIRVPVEDFPTGVPVEEWINAEVWYSPESSGDYKLYKLRNPPMIDRGHRITMNIVDEQAVLDDTPGAGHGKTNRNFRRPYR